MDERIMPTYSYECKSCKHNFDVFQSMKDEPLKTCPKCGKAVRRLINGGGGIIFKGNGFYVTDKNGKNPGSGGGEKAGGTEKAAVSCQGCARSETLACPKAANS